jgi:hypothetical protein
MVQTYVIGTIEYQWNWNGTDICYWCNTLKNNACQNQISKSKKWQNRDHWHIYTWPLTFLAWYKHFNKKKVAVLKLVLFAKTPLLSEMMPSCNCIPCVNKMPTHTYNRVNSVIINKAITLNILHNMLNLHDIEFVICMLLVLSKRADENTKISQSE